MITIARIGVPFGLFNSLIEPSGRLEMHTKSRQFVSSKVINADKVMFETLVSKKELVNGLGVSSSFISKLMVEEGLPYYKIGRAVRFRISEIAMWLERRKMP